MAEGDDDDVWAFSLPVLFSIYEMLSRESDPSIQVFTFHS